MNNYDELRQAQDDVRTYRSALLKLNRENAALRAALESIRDCYVSPSWGLEAYRLRVEAIAKKALGDAS